MGFFFKQKTAYEMRISDWSSDVCSADLAGEIESGFAQADVVHDAYYAEGAFAGRPAMRNLRVIANLYAERLQVVARKGAGIDAIGDLAGKRVSLDEPGSGTLLMARMQIGRAHV